MNVLIGMISANLSLSILSSIGGAVNMCYSLSNNLTKSSESDLEAIKQLIEENDLLNMLLIIKEHTEQIKVTAKQMVSVNILLSGIYDTIEEINEEHKTIKYRTEYNKGAYFFKYRFNNCYKRLSRLIKLLKVRYNTLVKIVNCRMSKKR